MQKVSVASRIASFRFRCGKHSLEEVTFMLRARNECPVSDQDLYELAFNRHADLLRAQRIVIRHFPKTSLIAKKTHKAHIQVMGTYYTLEDYLAVNPLEVSLAGEKRAYGTRKKQIMSDNDAERLAILLDRVTQDSIELYSLGMKRFTISSTPFRIICRSGSLVQKLNAEVQFHLIDNYSGWDRKYDEPRWCQTWCAFN